jgi:YegS/Rv2252/BmrU family lipid kinase
MKKLLIIVNPKSGTGRKNKLRGLVTALKSPVEVEIVETSHSGHCREICELINAHDGTRIAVAGGDGTVREAGVALCGTDIELAIIPSGSGNGIARHFNIPLRTGKALELALAGNAVPVDTMLINNARCLGVAGVGFDGMIATLFSQAGVRGPVTYARLILRHIAGYKAMTYTVDTGTKPIRTKALAVVIANTSQFGNNARISPGSDADDGRFEVCIINPVPLHLIPFLALKLFMGNITNSPYVTMYRTDRAVIENPSNQPMHLDGDPVLAAEKICAAIAPASLRLVVPPKETTT